MANENIIRIRIEECEHRKYFFSKTDLKFILLNLSVGRYEYSSILFSFSSFSPFKEIKFC